MTADSPLFYHRLEEAPGAVTAADSSGNGNVGVHGSSSQSQSWSRHWPLDENTGSTSRDLAGLAPTADLTLSGATWTSPGRSGSALAFNGTSHYAATTVNAMAADASFTVSAWVYLTDLVGDRTAVSQVNSAVSGFELGYDDNGFTDRWIFAMRNSNNAAAAQDIAISTSTPTLNEWTHLMATFDATTNAMVLYVNGIAQTGDTLATAEWAASGLVEIGAGKTTTRNDFWKGNIDDVRIQTIVRGAAGALEQTIGSSAGPATSWEFEENTGTTTSDSGGHLNTGTLGSATTWGTAKWGTSAVSMNGDTSGNNYVAGSQTGVDTSKSFTVAAWVYITGTTLAAKSRIAVSQSGTLKSGFSLKYNHYVTAWQFALTQGAADDYSSNYDSSYSANASATLNTWVHLVGVHDAVAQTGTLYVNGVAQTPVAHTSTFNAVGPLQVGRIKEYGAWKAGATPPDDPWGPWAGRIDDVRVYPYALSEAAVYATYVERHRLHQPRCPRRAPRRRTRPDRQHRPGVRRVQLPRLLQPHRLRQPHHLQPRMLVPQHRHGRRPDPHVLRRQVQRKLHLPRPKTPPRRHRTRRRRHQQRHRGHGPIHRHLHQRRLAPRRSDRQPRHRHQALRRRRPRRLRRLHRTGKLHRLLALGRRHVERARGRTTCTSANSTRSPSTAPSSTPRRSPGTTTPTTDLALRLLSARAEAREPRAAATRGAGGRDASRTGVLYDGRSRILIVVCVPARLLAGIGLPCTEL